MITFSQKGDFKTVTGWLERIKELFKRGLLDEYGRRGVQALKNATPVDTGLTAASWYYEIENQNGVAKLNFYNSNVNEGVAIAIILQYGHGTGTGGWVQGTDYINPAILPVFEDLATELWEKVTSV